MQAHQYANLFPMMSEAELKTLIDDMKANGYDTSSPIITYQGMILDGRNRYRAAAEASVIPSTVEYSGDDPLAFVLRHNLHRRHLNETQRAGVAAKLATMKQGRQNKHANLHVYGDEEDANAFESKPMTRDEAASMLNVGSRTVATYSAVAAAMPELKEKMDSGELTANKAYKQIKTAKAHEAFTAQTQTKKNTATVEVMDACQWLSSQDVCDLLITDPPYMTDVEDIGAFATWLTYALDYVKDTGHAYIFIGAYPEEVKAYLNVEIPKHIELCQLLVWTYKNTLGNNPKDRYKLNYQTCLYFKGVNADNLDCPITNEQWAVQEVNAPDGRLGDRYHSWQKPIELAERFIRHSTKENDVVYDPFACTGTFLLAAAGLGRVATGCDISKDNLDIAIERGCKYA